MNRQTVTVFIKLMDYYCCEFVKIMD